MTEDLLILYHLMLSRGGRIIKTESENNIYKVSVEFMTYSLNGPYKATMDLKLTSRV